MADCEHSTQGRGSETLVCLLIPSADGPTATLVLTTTSARDLRGVRMGLRSLLNVRIGSRPNADSPLEDEKIRVVMSAGGILGMPLGGRPGELGLAGGVAEIGGGGSQLEWTASLAFLGPESTREGIAAYNSARALPEWGSTLDAGIRLLVELGVGGR